MNVWIWALLLSPATLSFQVLHPKSGYSKELIHIAALALFCILLREFKITAVVSTSILTAAMVLGVLSHEEVFFYAPYFFAALVLGGRSATEALKECAIPAISGLVVIWICSNHIGNVQIATGICTSLGYKFIVAGSQEVCGSGAIPYLMRSREYARAETLSNIYHYQYFAIFPFFAALGLLPAVGESLVLVRTRLKRDVIIVWLSVSASFIGTLVLFYYAYDWGRWIYVHMASIGILLTFLDGKAFASSDVTAGKVVGTAPGRRIAYAAFLFAYATLWILPNGIEPIRFGYISRALYLSHLKAHATAETREPVN